MSRQIKIRRGTSVEHNTFTGALGEVTMDTDAKTLRVHDGVTPGGTPLARASDGIPANADYVVAFQTPSAANGYTWYRKYKSGWVEQGGCILPTSQENSTITLPIKYSNAYYTLVTCGNSDANMTCTAMSKTANSFTVGAKYNMTWYPNNIISWYASGFEV
ncbi:hypothetical protein HDR63_02210 [bacterium]|nr:hypothetical protein [bacterium]